MDYVDFFHKEFRTKRAGFPDLLRYASVIKPGVILGKGGELIATFQYRGPDVQCSSQSELNQLRMRVAVMVKRMSSGWMLHSSTLRKESLAYSDGGAFPDRVTRAIEQERREQYRTEGTHYENDYFLTFTFLPDAMIVSKIKNFAFETDDHDQYVPARIAAKSIEYFERQLSDYVSELEIGLGTLVRVTSEKRHDPVIHRDVWFDNQLSYFHECITGIAQPIRLPVEAVPFGVDFLIGSYEFLPGIRPRLGNKFISVVAIESPPDEGTVFGMLEILNHLSVEFRWTTRWIVRDTEKVKTNVRKIRAKWRQKIRGFIADVTGRQGGAPNLDAANMAADAEMVLTDLESGEVAYGQWSSTVVLMHRDSSYLSSVVQYLLKNIRSVGFSCREETVNCTEAFLGSLPGHGYENLRRPEIHSMNLADCLPLSSVWQGPVANPCEFYKKFYDNNPVPPLLQGAASGGTPFRLVLHNGDTGHTFIAGPTGAGKSVLLGLIAASHFRYPQAKFFGFEKGESMLGLCLAAGGAHYNFMDEDTVGADSIGFAPFSQIHRLSERIWAADYVATILRLHDVKVDMDIRAEINRALELLATRPQNMRSITDLIQLIQTRQIRQVLELYESDMAGGMLNFRDDSLSISNFMVFELEQLMSMGDVHVVPVLLYLFRMIERALDGSPVIISLDEAWLMLQHPLFQEQLKEWLKVLRKANALVIFATQELQDVADSAIASTVFSSCQTKILLPNPEANSTENSQLYRNIGLTEREIELLTYATPKRDYFFKSPIGRRLFQLELGPVALAFIAASGKDDRIVIKDLKRLHGDNWTEFWLRRKGLDPHVLSGAT
jgi:type IV secretion system protein VirB4